MLKEWKSAREFGSRFKRAADQARGAYREGRVEQEPAITDRMIASIEAEFNSPSEDGLFWRAKTLTDRGAGSQEKQFGADFLGVLRVSVGQYRVAKGFLAQAKLATRNSARDRRKLVDQCRDMLDLSPDSFVFVYSTKSFRVVPAISVLAAAGRLDDLYSRGIRRFFEAHVECFIGDENISSPTPTGLERLAEAAQARTAFDISLSDEPQFD